MYQSGINFNSIRSLWRAAVLSCIFIAPVLESVAQNIHRANKVGPLSTQVNTFTGNLFIPRTDMNIPARNFDLNIAFYYNSYASLREEGFGKGWSFGYNMKCIVDSTGARTIVWGDGRKDRYDSVENGQYKTPRGFFNRLVEYEVNKFKLVKTDSITYVFADPVHQKLTRMEEPNGNYINFNYTNSQLTSMVNAAGQAVTFTYANGRLASIVDAIASPVRTFTYTYDVTGNLKEVTDPLGGKDKYTYLLNGPMSSVSDKNSNLVNIIYYPDFRASELIGCNKRISFSYDTTSRTSIVTDHIAGGENQVTKYIYKTFDNLVWLTSVTGNCCGYNLSYEFDDYGNKVKEKDANGNVYAYTYDTKGNMLTATDPLNHVRTFTYSPQFSKVTSYKDANGNLFTMEYDSKGNITKLNMPGGVMYTATYTTKGEIATSTDPKGNVYTYQYDLFGTPATVTGPNGYFATLSYDGRGHLLAYSDSKGYGSSSEYDILDRLKKIIDPLNNTRQFSYDAQGNLISYKNEDAATSLIAYDASNRVVKVTGPDGSHSEFAYDGMNNLLEYKNALGHQRTFNYDKLNRMAGRVNQVGEKATYSYDPNGNVTGISYPNGQSYTYQYDALDRVISVSDITGTLASLQYDNNNNVVRYINASGATLSAVYDSLNRVKQVTDALSNTTKYTYDRNGNITAVVDMNGHTSNYEYDAFDRLVLHKDQNGFVTTLTRDAEGNVTQMKDAKSRITTYTYDSLNRVKRTTYADGSFSEYNYDKKGNIAGKRLTDGTSIIYEYDVRDRIVKKTLPGGLVFTYTYDAANRITSATNEAGTVAFTYDAANRLLSESFDGRTTSYSYNTQGRSHSITYPDGTVVTKEFDTRNRIVRISKNSELLVQYSYNNFNQLLSKEFRNGVQTTLEYDFANRLSQIRTAAGTIQNSVFSYDKEQNKTAIIRNNKPGTSEEFSYDNNYRLTSYKRGIPGQAATTQHVYTYDSLGNRLSANQNGINTVYASNNLNQLISSNNGSQPIAYTFDSRGNLTYDGLFYKSYDAENRLVKDSASPLNVISYGYDAMNRRIRKTTNGNMLRYSFSGLTPIEERNAGNTVINRTIFEDMLSPVVNDRGGNSFFYHTNEMNSVEAISNSGGRLVERYQYDAFGKQVRFDSLDNIINASIAGNRFGFTGQEYDSATASYRFFYRQYSPETGVFNQRDLMGYGDGMGMYQYLGNNPANGIDVYGLDDCPPKKKKSFAREASEKGISAAGFTTNEIGESAYQKSGIAERGAANADFANMQGENTIRNNVKAEYNDAIRKPGKNNPLRNANSESVRAARGTAAERAVAANAPSGPKGPSGGGAKVLKTAGNIAGGADVAMKGYAAADEWTDGMSNEQRTDEWTATGDVGLSIMGFHPIGAVYGLLDFTTELATGESLSKHAGRGSADMGSWYAHKMYGVPMVWQDDIKCPPEGGEQEEPPSWSEGFYNGIFILFPLDPNEILGPTGEPGKAWVSVKDRLSYTILFENDSNATAPAKYVRVTTPIEAKQDPATFELGSFGFNNQSFSIPANTPAYYQRLDCRDSMNMYVDITAGYDQLKNEAFWEFRSINPVTLLPEEDPLTGFLFLQDSTQPAYGNGFVNFSIKPRQTAVTLDTISAKAFIVFDDNDTIPTNIHKNTIDAVAPTSSLAAMDDYTPDTEVNLHFTGTDDVNGSGVKWYSIYVSDNNAAPELYVSNMPRTDTSFRGIAGHTYKFYVSATDTAGNVEALRLVDSVAVTGGEQVICPDESISLQAKITGTTYQWLVDNGSGYVPILNSSLYSGRNTDLLTINNPPTSMYGYRFRCRVDGSMNGPEYILKFGMNWEGGTSDAWENPANWSCGTVPDANTDVTIEGNKTRYPQVSSNVMIRSLRLQPGATGTVNTGFRLTILK